MGLEVGSSRILQQKIKELEDELSKTKYNKRTQNAIGLLKAKIANLKEKAEQKAKKGGPLYGFAVKKTGDATVIFVGFPSVGKSTLLNKLTNAQSEVAHYAFTTLTVIPGVMDYRNLKIQLLDVPGILEGAADGTGRGKEVISMIRNADLCLIIFECSRPEEIEVIKAEVYRSGVRMNEHPPDVKITKMERGGIVIGSTVRLTKISEQLIKEILQEFRIMNAHILIREDLTAERLIDVIRQNCKYLPGIIVGNKVDMITAEERGALIGHCDIMISARSGLHLEELREMIFQRLNFIRIFCKEAGKKADREIPLILKKGSTIEDVCIKLHRDFVSRFKLARVWGRSAKFPGQQHGLSHTLQDEDIVELHLR